MKQFNDTISTISFAKVMMLFCVMLGHCCTIFTGNNWGGIVPRIECSEVGNITLILSTFHTQTFFCASGFLFSYIRYEKGGYRNTKYDIIKRFKRLIVPYVLISILWAIPADIFVKGFSFYWIIKNYLLIVNPAQLWFLVALFGLFIIFYFCSDILLKIQWTYGILICFVVRVLCSVLSMKFPMGIFSIVNIMDSMLYFYLGIIIQRQIINIPSTKWIPVLICLECGGFELYKRGCIDGNSNFFVDDVITVFVNIVGIFMVFAVCSTIKRMSFFNSKIMKKIELYSMGIFLLHQQILYFTMRILNQLTIIPIVFVVINLFCAVFFSFIITDILSRFRVGKIILGSV